MEKVSRLSKSMELDLPMKQSLIMQDTTFNSKTAQLLAIMDDVEKGKNMSEPFSDVQDLMESLTI